MEIVEERWCACMSEISKRKRSLAIADYTFNDRNNKMLEEHQKILQTNVWLTRKLEE